MPADTGELDLTIIVVSFNTCEITLACLQSVISETIRTKYELIVVDNNSTDGSADAIQTRFSNIILLRLNENIGFARANNIAAGQARGRRLLLLNPDTVVLDRAIDRLVAFADDNVRCRVWGGRTLAKDGSLNPKSCWRKMTLWNQFCFAFGLSKLMPHSAILNSESYGGWDRNTVRHVDIVSGCFLLIDRDMWNELAGFDPTFIMYAEDADLCLRACKAGADPTITPSATILHYGGASERSKADKLVRLFKGKATIILRHWPPYKRPLGLCLMSAAALVRWWGCRMLTLICPRAGFGPTAEEWRKVWDRRSEWIAGY